MGVEVREKVKGSNDWYIFINYKSHRKAKHVGKGKEGKRAALVAKQKIQAKLALGDLTLLESERAPTLTVRGYAEQWLRSDAALRLKPITLERYTIVLNRQILPAFGHVILPDLSRPAIKAQLAAWLANGKVRGKGPPPREHGSASGRHPPHHPQHRDGGWPDHHEPGSSARAIRSRGWIGEG